jgi:hypothetical protein
LLIGLGGIVQPANSNNVKQNAGTAAGRQPNPAMRPREFN